jgi:hypothetical protein
MSPHLPGQCSDIGLTPVAYRSRYGLPPGGALPAPGLAAVKAAEGRTR